MVFDKQVLDHAYKVLSKHCFQTLKLDEEEEILTIPSIPNLDFVSFLHECKIKFQVETANGIKDDGSFTPMANPKKFVTRDDDIMVDLEKIQFPFKDDTERAKVGYVLDADIHSPSGELYLFIKWKELDHDENLWIPLAKLMADHDLDAVQLFFALLKHDEMKWRNRFDENGKIKAASDSINSQDSMYEEIPRIDLDDESSGNRSADTDEYTITTVDDEEEYEKDWVDKLVGKSDFDESDDSDEENNDEDNEDEEMIEYPSHLGEDDPDWP